MLVSSNRTNRIRRFGVSVLGVSALTLMLAGCSGPTSTGKQMRAEARGRVDAVNAYVNFDQARQEFRSGQFDRALKAINIAISQAPKESSFELLKGRIYLEMHKLEKASEALAAAIEKKPEFAEPHYYAGIVYQRWSNDAKALEHYRQAHELEPDNIQYLLATAEAMIALDQLDVAEQLVRSRLAYFENHAALRHMLGQIALLKGDAQTAVNLYRENLMLDSGNVMLLEELVWAEYAAGEFNACLESIKTLRQLSSTQLQNDSRSGTGSFKSQDTARTANQTPAGASGGRADLRHLEAKCLVMAGRPLEAHPIYMELTRASGSNAMLWIEFGTLAWKLGDEKRLALCAARATALAPERFEGYLLKGIYEQQHQRPEEAVIFFQQAAQRAAENPVPHLLLGRALEGQGELQQALTSYEIAIAIDPQSNEAHALHQHLLDEMSVAAAKEE